MAWVVNGSLYKNDPALFDLDGTVGGQKLTIMLYCFPFFLTLGILIVPPFSYLLLGHRPSGFRLSDLVLVYIFIGFSGSLSFSSSTCSGSGYSFSPGFDRGPH